MDRSQLFYRLELHNHPPFDQQISSKPFFKRNPIVFKPYSFLPLDLKSAFLQSLRQQHLIYGFQ